MATVSVSDGIEYGIGLMGYLFGIGIIGGLISFFGVALARDGGVMAVIGALVSLTGVLVIIGGMMGLSHKIIADSVTVGIEAAGGPKPVVGNTTERHDTGEYELHPDELELSQEELTAFEAALEYIKREGPAFNEELQKEIYPDYPCGWESADGWLDEFLKPLLASHPGMKPLRAEGDKWIYNE